MISTKKGGIIWDTDNTYRPIIAQCSLFTASIALLELDLSSAAYHTNTFIRKTFVSYHHHAIRSGHIGGFMTPSICARGAPALNIVFIILARRICALNLLAT